jgi:hypothetical protein
LKLLEVAHSEEVEVCDETNLAIFDLSLARSLVVPLVPEREHSSRELQDCITIGFQGLIVLAGHKETRGCGGPHEILFIGFIEQLAELFSLKIFQM